MRRWWKPSDNRLLVLTADKSSMWTDGKSEGLVQCNEGFKNKLVGTKEQNTDRVSRIKALGFHILQAFLHCQEEIEQLD